MGDPTNADQIHLDTADYLMKGLAERGAFIVPIDPTPEMIAAGLAERNVNGSGERGLPHIWRAMVKAAQS
jgi:hypothetical protein